MEVIEIKNWISEAILAGDITKSVIEKLTLANGTILPKECELWDFKKEFADDKDSYLKTLKSIVSFHNTFGGYLIYGIDETTKDTTFEVCGVNQNLIDQQKLRGQFDKYFNYRIDLTYTEIELTVSGEMKLVGLLHIPKREEKIHTVAAITEGVNSKNKIIFAKNAVYIRKVDECKQVITQSDFEFVVSQRSYIQNDVSRKNIIEHNLPDKNFICPVFIGRFEILQELWSWLSDDFQYTKVLAADGGKGKTSLAYEFCQLFIQSGSKLYEQVIWLTAKKRQFKASFNEYISTPETHYQDIESLLKEICLRTGSLEDDIQDCTLQQLQRLARESLEIMPSFIVVDDIDSNSPEMQRRIMEMTRTITSQNSKILMTTRVNNIYSLDSSILIPGLEGEDFKELTDSICSMLKLPFFNEKNVNKLQLASEGSPLYAESILRLCKLGLSIDNAIKEWGGRSGDSVREAALRKEVAELTMESFKVLLTISYFESLSRTELVQYTELENFDITVALEQLGNLFLIQGIEFIEEEPRFESTSSISKLVLSLAAEFLPNADTYLNRVDEIAKGLKENNQDHVPEVGSAISQCNSLLKEERYDDARNTVKALLVLPRYKENGDLHFMLAKTEYVDPNSDTQTSRKAFVDAYMKGQRKPVFFEMWYQIEKINNTTKSLYEVCQHALKALGNHDNQWGERFSFASYEMALITSNFNRKIRYLVDSYEKSSRIIKFTKGDKFNKLKDLNIEIVDLIWSESLLTKSYDIACKGVINAINGGDIRSINFERLIECSDLYSSTKSVSLDARKELKECLEWSPKLIRSNNKSRESLALRLEQSSKNYSSNMEKLDLTNT